MTRRRLIALGYRALCKSSDLFAYGYTVVHWYSVQDHDEILEYRPHLSNRPVRYATNYEEQVCVHRDIGAPIVPPGHVFTHPMPLFDHLLIAPALPASHPVVPG